MSKLNRFWYQKHWAAFLLRPLSYLFRFIVFIRRSLYRFGVKKTTKFSMPVIVVGNITVGGTGKTPLVSHLAHLLKSKGYRPGIVSRGFSATAKSWPQRVTDDSDVFAIGDEVYMLRHQTGCPIVVDPDRVRAVKTLMAENDCNIVISDDGMQHYAMHRDIEIAVVDGVRQFGNHYCLPAGPLREPLSRLHTVDFIVTNGASLENNFTMHLNPGEIYNVADPSQRLSLSDCLAREWHAVAGIGHPERFFFQLENLGFKIHGHGFPDHHAFSAADIIFAEDEFVIMTEKDAVKCKAFADHRHWCLPVRAELDAAFDDAVLERLLGLQVHFAL